MAKKTKKQRLLASSLLAGLAALGAPLLAAGTLALMPGVARAQDYTSVTLDGRAVDGTGKAIPGASVSIRSVDQAFERTATAGRNGDFSISGLPVGVYAVRIESAGFATYTDDAVPLRVGASSYSFTLAPAQAAEGEIVVTGKRTATLDFNRTAKGLIIDVTELASRVPVGRDIASLALLAPGAAQGDQNFLDYDTQPSLSGTSIAENAYYVNGLNITNHRTQIGGSRVPFDFLDTVEVRTGGYQAEYGRTTGGLINTITKSGSNTFHGGLVGTLSPEQFNADTAPNTFLQQNDHDEDERADVSMYLSGPIVKDKLFFFALYQPRLITSSDTTNPGEGFEQNAIRSERTNKSPFAGGKLDYNISDNHRLEFTFIDDTDEEEVRRSRVDRDTNAFIESRGTYTDGAGGETYIAKYTGEFTNWFSLSALVGTNRQSDFRTPEDDSVIPVVQTYTGTTVELGGPWSVQSQYNNEDIRDVYRIDADFDFTLLGKHHLRVGVDREELESTQNSRRSGPAVTISDGPFAGQTFQGYRWVNNGGPSSDYPGGSSWYLEVYQNNGAFQGTQTAYYIQDSWEVLNGLTLQLGLRNESFENKNIDGETIVTVEDQIAPRIGVSWDPGRDGQSKLYGSFGRYFLPVATNTNIRLGGSETYFRVRYRGTGQINSVPGDLTPGGALTYRDTQTFADGSVYTPAQVVAQDLDPFYEDEFIVGYERSVKDWTFGLSYTHRELKEVIEDIAIDEAVLAYCRANGVEMSNADGTGCADVYSGFHQYVLANPGSDVTVQLNSILPGDTGYRTVRLSADDLGYPKAERTYDAIDFTFVRPFDGRWSVQGSYTWALSEGNYEGAVKSDIAQDDSGLTQDFDVPSLMEGAYGYLPNHREHTLRVFGVYAPWERFQIGGNFLLQSPKKFGCIGNYPDDANFAYQYGAASWYCTTTGDPADSEQTDRGSRLESDWLTQVDLSFIYKIPVTSGQADLRFDIFNVFNSQAVVDIQEEGEIDLTYAVNPNYGKPEYYQSPRYARVGFAYRF